MHKLCLSKFAKTVTAVITKSCEIDENLAQKKKILLQIFI